MGTPTDLHQGYLLVYHNLYHVLLVLCGFVLGSFEFFYILFHKVPQRLLNTLAHALFRAHKSLPGTLGVFLIALFRNQILLLIWTERLTSKISGFFRTTPFVALNSLRQNHKSIGNSYKLERLLGWLYRSYYYSVNQHWQRSR